MDNESDPVSNEFETCLGMILSGTTEEICKGWSKLSDIEKVSTNLKHLLKDGMVLRKILNGQVWVSNYYETSRLMSWYSKYITENTTELDLLSNDIAIFLKNAATNDIFLLVSITEALFEHEEYLPVTANHTKLCEAIVICLASLQMPNTADKISEFNENISKVQKFLTHLSSSEKRQERVNLIIPCFAAFYEIIADTTRTDEPGPALAIILELVDTTFIPQAVQYIISESRGDEQLIQALKVLCLWSTKWLRSDRLGIWIMAFIQELEAKRKFSILKAVTEPTLERLFIALLLPMGRQNLSSIVFHVLRRQATPTLFHKISRRIQLMIPHLLKDNSEHGKECVQNIVDVMTALMIRFPGYVFYDILKNTLPVKPRMHVVREIINGPVWSDDLEELEPFNFRSNSKKVGLTNLGNTCYMNSVLQALLMTSQFCYEVLNHKSDNIDELYHQVVLNKLENLFALLLYSKRISLAPTEILLASRPAYFMPGQQQDSSEFLCHLLDVLYEQEKTAKMQCRGKNTSSEMNVKFDGQSSSEMAEAEDTAPVIKRWTTEEDLTEDVAVPRKTQSLADFTQGEGLPNTEKLNDSHSDSNDSGIQFAGGEEEDSTQDFRVHRVFGGKSKITYQCAQCDTSSHNTDRFRDLQLCFPVEIQENQEVSVQDLINYYLTPEKLTGENKYRCDKCMKLCDAQRIIKILQAPSHLILTLKHFHYDSESRLRTKLRHKVMYNETIQLPVSAQSCMMTETYKLYAAVVHSGYSLDYGHYFTYACDSRNNWFKFNDSYVSQTTLEDFKGLEPPDTPYILFYAKISGTGNVYDKEQPDLQSLSKRIQELVAMDTIAYKEELRHQAERKINQRSKTSMPLLGLHDNSDDENPPPSSCRSAVDIQPNRFLY